MKTLLSVALSADGCLDDRSPQRLVLSGSEDWAAVHRLRAASDAILVGAGTLRADNPALVVRDEALRTKRVREGMPPDLMKVVVSGSGRLDPALRFFTEGAGEKVVITEADSAPEWPATVVRMSPITAAGIVTALERRGIRRLMVEGGGRILRLFLEEGMADMLRLAVAPHIHVRDSEAPRLCPEGVTMERLLRDRVPRVVGMEQLGAMTVMTYDLSGYDAAREAHDLERTGRAVAVAEQAPACADAYRVGALIETTDGRLFSGYTHQSGPRDHAEEAAIGAALAAGSDLKGATLYSSMEPCSVRASKPESCTALLLRHGFARVVFALYEPDRFAHCTGALTLRRAGVDVRSMPSLADAVRRTNGHLLG